MGEVSKLLNRAGTLNLLSSNDLHIIGHSLGAQTAGAVGRDFYSRSINEQKYQIQTIVSLDGACPNFSDTIQANFLAKVLGKFDQRYPCLNRDDAIFVQHIYTSYAG